MRANFYTLILVLLTTVSFGQNQISEHLSFKGVPIDGTLNNYISRMKESGFSLQSTEDGFAVLNGDFAGYKDCYVGVSTLKQKDLVHKINVIFPNKDTWSALSGNYFDLKQMLTEKYGEPFEVEEKFDTEKYSQPKDDNSRMYEVKFDRCRYASIFQTGKGSIELSIKHSGVRDCFVALTYFDRINGSVIKAKAKDDL